MLAYDDLGFCYSTIEYLTLQQYKQFNYILFFSQMYQNTTGFLTNLVVLTPSE